MQKDDSYENFENDRHKIERKQRRTYNGFRNTSVGSLVLVVGSIIGGIGYNEYNPSHSDVSVLEEAYSDGDSHKNISSEEDSTLDKILGAIILGGSIMSLGSIFGAELSSEWYDKKLGQLYRDRDKKY